MAIASVSCSRSQSAERGLGRNKGFEIVLAVVAAAGAGGGPFRIADRDVRDARRGRLAIVVIVLAGAGAGRVVTDVTVEFEFAVRVVADFAAIAQLAIHHRLVRGRRAFRLDSRLGLGAAVEQRVLLELGLDIGDQIEIGELQQLDGLHQLRRHHQRLTLSDL